MSDKILYKEESYKIIGCCFEVHKILGKGFSEIVYKDALEFEFSKNEIFFEREKEFKIKYKNITLSHYYYADFVLFNKIILEIKAIGSLTDGNTKQSLNYLAASNLKLAILVNFGEDSLKYKRILL